MMESQISEIIAEEEEIKSSSSNNYTSFQASRESNKHANEDPNRDIDNQDINDRDINDREMDDDP